MRHTSGARPFVGITHMSTMQKTHAVTNQNVFQFSFKRRTEEVGMQTTPGFKPRPASTSTPESTPRRQGIEINTKDKDQDKRSQGTRSRTQTRPRNRDNQACIATLKRLPNVSPSGRFPVRTFLRHGLDVSRRVVARQDD